jgi:hypothetical protein
VVSDQAGQNVQMLAAAEAPFGIVIAGDDVYWTNDLGTTVAKAPLGGGPATMIATGIGRPAQIAVDEHHAVFTAYDDGKIYRVPR